MKKDKRSNTPVEHKVGLQLRVLYRDSNGKISDVTQNDEVDRGLNDLQNRSSSASDSLTRVRELLQLLGLAAANRDQVDATLVDATLVQRVLQEVEVDLEDSGELGNYVLYSQELFEEAVALPCIRGITPSPSTLKAVS